MKPRKVVATIELTTDLKLSELKEQLKYILDDCGDTTVNQVSVNVVRPEKSYVY